MPDYICHEKVTACGFMAEVIVSNAASSEVRLVLMQDGLSIDVVMDEEEAARLALALGAGAAAIDSDDDSQRHG